MLNNIIAFSQYPHNLKKAWHIGRIANKAYRRIEKDVLLHRILNSLFLVLYEFTQKTANSMPL